MIELEKEASNANEFVEKVKLDLFGNQVFCFTPMGDIIDLPLNATPIDFAFRIHSEVGYKTTGVLINGRIAQLDAKLKNGDIVEFVNENFRIYALSENDNITEYSIDDLLPYGFKF